MHANIKYVKFNTDNITVNGYKGFDSINYTITSNKQLKSLIKRAIESTTKIPFDDPLVYSTKVGWVQQSKLTMGKQSWRKHFGVCTHTCTIDGQAQCLLPAYSKQYKRGHTKFDHMTHDMYKLLKVVNKICNTNFNFVVLTEYNYNNKECIGFHTDTRTNNPEGISQRKNTDVLSITTGASMGFFTKKTKTKKSKQKKLLTRLDKNHMFRWKYSDDQRFYHTVNWINKESKKGDVRTCLIFRELQLKRKFVNSVCIDLK